MPDYLRNAHIRQMIRRDLPDVLAIEQASFCDPWGEQDFCAALSTRNCIGMVVVDGNELFAYAVYDLWKRCVDVMNIAVHPHFRRRKVASSMMAFIRDKHIRKRRNHIEAEVSEYNLTGQLFLKALGFRCEQTFRTTTAGEVFDAYKFFWRKVRPSITIKENASGY